MNKDQLQSIHDLKYNLTCALADIANICPQIGIDSQTPASLIRSLDNSFRLIYSTNDPNLQLNYLNAYFNKDFQQLVKWENEIFPLFEQNSKDIKTNTISAFQQNLQVNEEINEKMNELDAFDEPFKNIDQVFFDYNKFIESLPIKDSFSFLEPIYKQVNYYEKFYTFLKNIKLMEEYKEKFYIENSMKIKPIDENTNIEKTSQTDVLQPTSKFKGLNSLKLLDNQQYLHPKELKQDKDGKHHGVLSLSGLNLHHKDLKKKLEPEIIKEADQNLTSEGENSKIKISNSQTNIEDPDRDFVNEYNAFVARIEGDGSKPTMTAEERIQARIQQKLMILEHESQILRDNLFIVTKQKEEMIQTYEKHIKEIEKQNKKLYEENEFLKKKSNKDGAENE